MVQIKLSSKSSLKDLAKNIGKRLKSEEQPEATNKDEL